MMRPLSLAGIFAGLNGSSLGAINTLRGLWLEPPRDGRILAISSAESIVPLYVSFSCLMLAWLLVPPACGGSSQYRYQSQKYRPSWLLDLATGY